VFFSLRSRLVVALLSLGLLAPAVTSYEATSWASQSLTEASYAKLAAVRETRRRHIERWFADVSNHAHAMSTTESTLLALEQFSVAWPSIPPASSSQTQALLRWYDGSEPRWFPQDQTTQSLHYHFQVNAPPEGRDLQLSAEGLGHYGLVHAKHHPSLRAYLAAFGFYDVFLVNERGRVVYTVKKEADLGAQLTEEPYRSTGVARIFEKAMQADASQRTVIEDFSFYAASNAPAAFVAAPMHRAGAHIGVLIIQVSIDEINRVMTGDGQWKVDGLGDSGQAFIVGADGRFRSDLRAHIEQPETFLRRLEQTHGASTAQKVRVDRTEVLNVTADDDALMAIRQGRIETRIGADFLGHKALRSQTPMRVPGLDWWVIAEMNADEAFGPVKRLQHRMVAWGALFVCALIAASWALSSMIMRPLKALRDAVARIGARAFSTRIPVSGRDELSELAHAFNSMAADLEKTTVSKEALQQLAAQLIDAQEQERRTIARELHDDVGQRFAALSMDLTQLAQNEPTIDRSAVATRARETVLSLARDVRNLSRTLHPSVLDDLGLVAALESECRLFNERGLPVELHHQGLFDDVPRPTQLTLYRIVQEALHNVVKHAHANVAVVSLERAHDLRLTIVDDGKGFETTSRPLNGLGLSSMKERARLVGGLFRITSAPGQGTRVEVSVPMEAA
jgi:methyl-accepting chemotaxis protein